MNDPAQNALLKSLEEPPPGAIFILLTPYPELLRETILSRCWSISLKPLSNEHIIDILIKNFQISESVAKDVAPFSDGSVTKAIELIENDFENMKDKTISFLRYALGAKYSSAFNEINKFLSESDSDSIKLLIKMIIHWMNDVLKNRLNINDYYFESHKETIIKFNSRFSDTDINSVIKNIDYLSSTIRNNVNLNTICLNLIFELASLTHRFEK
jgi:DNA polymerase-3 subunit delta'